MQMKKLLIFFIVLSNFSFAQTWSIVGAPNFAKKGDALDIFSAVAPNGDIYVVYRENSITSGRVKKFNGSNWVDVGPNFSPGDVGSFTMAFDRNNTPYIAYTDYGDSVRGKGTIKKFDGSNWVSVGNPSFIATAASFSSIVIDNNGTPYVAFRDVLNNYRASVMKFDGTNWIYVGTSGFSALGSGAGGAAYTSLAIDKTGTLYVAYSDISYDFKANVMKFDGSSWVYVGAPNFSAWQANYTSIVLDSKGTPYVAYWDRANNGKATVMKFDGNNWMPVEVAGLSPGAVDYTSLTIDNNDVLYLAFEDHTNNNKATVMTFNGSNWVTIGNAGFSASDAQYTTIAIDKNKSILYVAYEDVYNDSLPPAKYNATVMKYNISSGIKETVNDYSMNIYPNPTNRIITINISNNQPKGVFKLKVSDTLGKTVYSETLREASTSFTKQIDLSQLPKGIYFVELQPNSSSSNAKAANREVKKIVLQ
jgi:hypothetical protein